MKKITMIAAALALSFTGLHAQSDSDEIDMKSKRNVPILPESGDIGLGVNATPFLNYLGNSFNGSTGNSTGFGFMNNNQMIFGKYFLDDDLAVRGSLRLSSNSASVDNKVTSDVGNSQFDRVEDTRTDRSHFYGISGGIEKRRGQGRIQGYYGAELMIGYSSSSTSFDYGNPMTADNPTPTTTADFTTGATAASGARTLDLSRGSTWMLQLRGFIGVEYFVAPKLSIGGEFGWGPGYQSTGNGETITESVNADNELQEISVESAGSRMFNMDTDNLSGSIRVMFHF